MTPRHIPAEGLPSTAPSPLEVKFLLDPARADAVRAWARNVLSPDPHGRGPNGDAYETTTLYFDTHALDVFHRRESFGRGKYRVRRYNDDPALFLERKLRVSDRVRKRRSAIAADELAGSLASGADPRVAWFGARVRLRQLQPVCRVRYSRIARVGGTPDEALRLTLDTDLWAAPASGLDLDGPATTPVFPDLAVLELKFSGPLPSIFRELAERFSLEPQAVSKYRDAAARTGLAAASADSEGMASVATMASPLRHLSLVRSSS